jgi:hypothetical protein
MGSLLTILVGLAVVFRCAIIWRAKPAGPTGHEPTFRRSPVAGRGSTAEVTLWKGRYLEAWSFLMYNLSLSRLENEVQI